MKRDIFGNIRIEPIDYVNFVVHDLKNSKKDRIIVNYETSRGFTLESGEVLPKSGIYAIYKEDVLVYIGCTNHSVHTRIGRFIAGVRGTERHDESHPAAYKYRKCYGNNVEGLYVTYCEINQTDLYCNIISEEIEEQVIVNMRPLFNEETYNTYKFEKKQVVTDIMVVTDTKNGFEIYA